MQSFEQKKERLKTRYDELLVECGLADATIPAAIVRDNFDAMYSAGWFAPVSHEKAWEQFSLRRQSMPAGFKRLVELLSADVEEAIRVRGGELKQPVFAGSWPIGYTNACAMPSESGSLVLVSAGMLSLLYQVGKQFLYSYDWITTADGRTLSDLRPWKKYDWTMEKTIDSLVDVFASYFRNGDPSTARRPSVPELDGRAATLSRLVHYAEHFLIAHEYAHVLLEHTSVLVSYSTPLGPLHDVAEWSRQQEYDADELAVSLTLATADLSGCEDGRLDANIRIAGILLFFTCSLFNDTVTQGRNGLATDSDANASHPPAMARIKNVSRCVGRLSDEFKILGDIVFGWAVPLSIKVAEAFHIRHRLANDPMPYLPGQYFPFQVPA